MNRIGTCNPSGRLAWLLVTAWALGVSAMLPAGAETITWSNAAGGSWNTAANWDPADVPDEAGEDALVADDAAAYTITLNVSPGLDAVAFQNPTATLNLGSFTLTLLEPAGLANAGLIQANTGNATINGSVFNHSGGMIQTLNNCNLSLSGPLVSNEGTITINALAGTGNSNLIASGNVSLEGTGVLRMTTAGNINDAELETGTGFVLTQQADHAIRGAGTINAALLNFGTVMADESGHSLSLGSNPKTNHGTMGAAASCFLDLEGFTLTQGPGGTLIGDEGIVKLGTGAVIIGGELASSGAGKISTASGGAMTLTDVHSTGIFEVLPGTVSLRGTLTTNDGTITLNPAGSASNSFLVFAEEATLGGSGECVMVAATENNDAEFTSAIGVTGQNGAGHTIRGSGTISAALTNAGVISGDDPVRSLDLTSKPKTNQGTLQATNDGRLNIIGCEVTQDPGAMILADNGAVGLGSGAAVTGGTLASSGTGKISTASGGAMTLTDVHSTGIFEVLPGTVSLRGTLTTNDGTITLNPAGSASNSFLVFAEEATLGGSGECVMVAATDNNDANVTSGPGVTGRNGAGHTIRGSGTIAAALTNAGVISGDDPVRSLDLTSNPKTNQATLQATNGGRLNISGCAVTQEPAATILADNGTVGLGLGGAITGGTLATANGGAIDAYTGTATLTDVTNQGQFGIRGGVTTALDGSHLTNQGTITVNSNESGANAILHAAGDVLLQGNGTMRLVVYDNQNDAAITTAAGVALTQAAGHEIRGSGEIRGVVINEGLICADDTPWILELDNAPKTNRGELRAEAGSVLRIANIAVTQEDDGHIVADNGIVLLTGAAIIGGVLESANDGAVNCAGIPSSVTDVTNLGTFGIAASTFVTVYGPSFANEGLIHVNYNGATSNATLTFSDTNTLTGTGEVRMQAASADLDDAAIKTLGDAVLTIGPGQFVHGSGRLDARMVNTGTIAADNPVYDLTCTSDSLVNQAIMRAENGGDLMVTAGALTNQASLAAVDTSRVIAGATGILTNQGEISCSDEGTLLVYSSGQLINEGLIRTGALGHFNVTDGSVKNYGTVRAEAQGSVWVDYGTYRSEGLTDVLAGGSFWSDRLSQSGHYSGTTLTGGTWQVAAGGSMQLIGCNVQTLKASAVLIGPGATIYSDNGTTDALAGLQQIQVGGHLEVRAGRDYGTPGSLTNAFGGLTVGAGCTFTVHGQYTQTGNGEIDRGVTCVDGTLITDAGTLAISSGTLCGSGVIADDVASGGWVKPGASIGTLTIVGDYAQSAGGTFDVQLGGTGPGASDLLHVNGHAALAGRLIVRSIEGYTPQVGDHFTILECGSRSGEFAIETGCPGLGLIYETLYYADHVEIEILGDASAVPDPELADDPELQGDPDDPGAPDAGGQTEPSSDGLSADPGTANASEIPTALALTARPLGGGAAVLRLALPEPAEIDLRLYDLSGRQVAVLARGLEMAGMHGYTWTGRTDAGRRLPSGVYLVAARVRAESGTLQRNTRVLLIR